jgi:pilus assembly protein Flp/PilA
MLNLYLKAQATLRFIAQEDGQDLIEYALLGALIAVACIASMNGVAAGLNTEFGKITAQLT